MTRSARTTRGRRRQTAVKVSLFPFLAVLICTMGALILLLVVLARQARLQADQTAQAEAQRHQEELQDELEMVQWRVEQLQASRAKTEDQLQQIRLLLGHLEDHARRLRTRLAELQHTLEQLRELGAAGEQKRAELRAEYEAVRAALEAAEKQLDKSRKELAHKQPAYAIIPYQGPHGTRRRPIYLECREDAVILQPEGIALVPEDFEGPQGPGNPLAAALRAAREYLLTQTGFDPEKDGEPYPLLLVRPRGIIAYYAAREAMKSWGSEFGYELIGDDWKLAFPRPDAGLAEVMLRAVETARARQRRLAAAAPRSYGSPSPSLFRISPEIEDAMPDTAAAQTDSPDAEQPRAELPYDRALSGAGPAGGFPGGGSSDPRAAAGTPGRGLPPAARVGGVQAGARGGGVQAGAPGSSALGSGAFGSGSSVSGPFAAGAAGVGGPASAMRGSGALGSGPGSGPSGGPDALGHGSGGPSTAGAGNNAPHPAAGSGAGPGQAGPGQAGPGQVTPRQAAAGRTPAATSGSTGPGQRGPSTGASSVGPSGAGAGSASGSMPGGQIAFGAGAPGSFSTGSAQAGQGAAADSPTSLADARGHDWALPQAAANAIAVVRPIRVDCYPDRLVLVPEQGLGRSKVIQLPPQTEAVIDEFVSAVWVYMQSWGIAGQGMYWRPLLSVRVAPGAESRFEQLRTLLEDSGLRVERKTR